MMGTNFEKLESYIYRGQNMRRKNKEDTEKIENMLKSVKAPKLSDKEIESYKSDFNRVLQEEFPNVTADRERRHVLRVKLAYGLAIFILVFTLFSFMYVKPYLIRVATARTISEQLKIKVALKDIITKDGVGIVIYNYKEITVNVLDEKVEIFQPIEYEPSDKEKEKAVEIVRNSKETKSFVAKEGEKPQDISMNDVVEVTGLLFPNSGKKLLEVSLAYTPTSWEYSPLPSNPHSQAPLMTAKFLVDIEKGEIQP